MRVSKEQAAENRDRILDNAARLFREHGFDGIGVADLMKSAGLTHGGFYGHFKSKEDLMAQAATRALEQSMQSWNSVLAEDGKDMLGRYLDLYLSAAHRDDPGAGCATAALAAGAARQGAPVREVVTAGIRRFIAGLQRVIGGDAGADAQRERAITTLSAMVGALVLARAVDDPALSDEILHSVSRRLREDARR